MSDAARPLGSGESPFYRRRRLRGVVFAWLCGMATLVGGTVIFESLFSLPGMGRHLILAVSQKDFAVVQGVALFFAITVVLVNLIVDVSYTVLDPRARH